MSAKKHIGTVDICRFAAILIIMTHHGYILGFSGDYPFSRGWAWVDYFFMLTGYFTIAHYENNPVTQGSCGLDALSYTFRKLKGLFPLVVITVLVQYSFEALVTLRQTGIVSAVLSFTNMPFEMLSLSSAFGFNPSVSPLWYLGAMLVTLPVICLFVSRYRDIWPVVAFLTALLYYGYFKVQTVRDWPLEMIRAFACMALGTLVYYFAGWIRQQKWLSRRKGFLTAVEAGAFLLAVGITLVHRIELVHLVLLFPLQLGIMMSGCSHTAAIHGKLWRFLGEMSMPMFIYHWTIGSLVQPVTANVLHRAILYYGGTLAAAAVTVMITRARKERHKDDQEQSCT
jgi:peptidoglycan/LPS O-acetylase OafA/YrhL